MYNDCKIIKQCAINQIAILFKFIRSNYRHVGFFFATSTLLFDSSHLIDDDIVINFRFFQTSLVTSGSHYIKLLLNVNLLKWMAFVVA